MKDKRRISKKLIILMILLPFVCILTMVGYFFAPQNQLMFNLATQSNLSLPCYFVGTSTLNFGDYTDTQSAVKTREICIGHVTGTNEDGKDCLKLHSQISQQTCMARISDNPKNPEDCESINNVHDYQSNCWYHLSQKENDKTYCEKITNKDSFYLERCLNEK